MTSKHWSEEKIIAEAEALGAHFEKKNLDCFEMSKIIIKLLRDLKDNTSQVSYELGVKNERKRILEIIDQKWSK